MQRVAVALILLVSLVGCGGGGGGTSTSPVAATPVTPAASITATGAGALVLHPSARPQWTFAMETPIRITESGGGSADWGFARLQIYLRGVEIERAELGASDIAAGNAGRINPSSSVTWNLIFRFNSDNFDQVNITLGFTDRKDSRQFTVAVPFGSFTGVNTSLTPLKLQWSRDAL